MHRLRSWASAPLVVPRWMLTVKYGLFVVLGTVSAWAGIPTLSLTTWAGYTTVWGALLAASAVAAAVASARSRWEPTERWAAVAIVSLLSVYAGSALVLAVGDGAPNRAALAIVLIIVTLLPGVRAGQLLLRTGMRRRPTARGGVSDG